MWFFSSGMCKTQTSLLYIKQSPYYAASFSICSNTTEKRGKKGETHASALTIPLQQVSLLQLLQAEAV